MVYVQMLYRRLGKTSILSVFEKIFKIPSGYVHLFSLPFLSSKKFIKSTANTPCFGRLKSRSNTPPHLSAHFALYTYEIKSDRTCAYFIVIIKNDYFTCK